MTFSIQKIVDRIYDIFSIFDFSYLVAGIATYLIVCYGLWRYELLKWSDNDFLNGTLSVLLSYLCGLISFTIGKSVRLFHIKYWLFEDVDERFMKCFNDAIIYSRDDNHPLKVYHTVHDCKLYYTEMWSFLRQCKEAAPTLSFVNRYWVMQAVYEGLSVSSLVGCILGIILCITKISTLHILIILTSIISLHFCCREGTRYAENQISEIIIAYKTFNFNNYDRIHQ